MVTIGQEQEIVKIDQSENENGEKLANDMAGKWLLVHPWSLVRAGTVYSYTLKQQIINYTRPIHYIKY